MRTKILAQLIVLPLSLGLAPLTASAIESGAEGTATNVNITVTSELAWTVLSSSIISIPAGQIWHCAANGSAEGVNPGGNFADMRYRFTLAIDSLNPLVDGACERTLQFDDNPSINDVNLEDVNSTCPFKNITSGTHVIRWLARKIPRSPDAPNLTVQDNSLTVVCSDNLL